MIKMPSKKVSNKRVPKPVKPPLKIPSKITVKIGSTGTKHPKTEKNISCERKIELANEVALAQLQAQSVSRKPHKPVELPTTQANNTQENVKKPIKKFTVASDVDSLEDFEITPEPKKKKRPGPKSITMPQTKNTQNLNPLVLVRNNQWEVKGKVAKPITKVKNTPKRKKQLKSVAVNLVEVLSEAETGAAHATTPTKPRGRPKGSVTIPKKTPATSKTLSAKEIKAAASMLEQALGISSQPHSRPNSVISNRSNLSWTRDISTESSFTSGTTCITAKSNDFVRFDYKLPLVQVENCVPPKVINVDCTPPSILPKVNSVTTHRLPSSVLSKDESSSSDSESSSSSSSSSDSELDGANTLAELNLSTSSLTSRFPISDTKIGRHIEIMKNVLKNFHSDIRKFVSHDDDDLCTYSEIYECVDRELNAIRPIQKSVDPDLEDIVDKCDNFDRDLEAMFHETYSSEKSVQHLIIAGFTEQNESKNEKKLEDSPRPSYECNRSESSNPERCRLRQTNDHKDSEAIFAKPDLVTRVSAVDSRDTTNLPDKQLVSNIDRVEASPTHSFKTFTSDDYNYVPFDRSDDADGNLDGDDNHDGDDDGDALSLYAESISGMESSKLDPVASVSISLEDVCIQKNSPTSCMREKYVYKPTKIQVHKSNLGEESIEEGEIISNKDDPEQEPGTKPKLLRACVSSSGSRDKKMALKGLKDSNNLSPDAEESIKKTEAQISSKPQQLFSSYTKMNPIRSSLYRGFCFFYIATQCKRGICRFPHIIIDSNTFKYRLTLLNQDNLIAEYLLMRLYGSLKGLYCILFVEECKRRTATRILLEMAIDLCLGFVAIDEDLRVKVLETTLLHLNTINLDECDDLLKFEHEGTMMCDALLSCMANSQNFEQFKRAFVKLANLMSELNRPVDIRVASSILERVCILPGEDFLARGMLTLIKNTDVSIFDNSLTESFEVQLSNIDSNVHAAYLLAKKAALEARMAQLKEMHPATPILMPRREEPRHTSPDTTNVDELPQTIGPVFTRTINDEALRSLFKPPAYPVPKRFVIPRLSQSSSRDRPNAVGPRRDRIAHQTPGERWVEGSLMVCRNVTTE